jgi:4-hydroxy-tetrahydrodipicolinate synthase
MNQQFTGAGVALITPFTKNDEVDFDTLDRVIENQVHGGMDYLDCPGHHG